jgi:hypothetical protein
VPTGFPHLDLLNGGLQAGTLVIVAGPTAVGTTTVGLHIARHASIRLRPPPCSSPWTWPRSWRRRDRGAVAGHREGWFTRVDDEEAERIRSSPGRQDTPCLGFPSLLRHADSCRAGSKRPGPTGKIAGVVASAASARLHGRRRKVGRLRGRCQDGQNPAVRLCVRCKQLKPAVAFPSGRRVCTTCQSAREPHRRRRGNTQRVWRRPGRVGGRCDVSPLSFLMTTGGLPMATGGQLGWTVGEAGAAASGRQRQGDLADQHRGRFAVLYRQDCNAPGRSRARSVWAIPHHGASFGHALGRGQHRVTGQTLGSAWPRCARKATRRPRSPGSSASPVRLRSARAPAARRR